MGISGLLVQLRSISTRRNVSEFSGETVAIDGYSWLHKALYSCGAEVALHGNLSAMLRYFERRIRHFLSLGISVIVVFDGDRLPLKTNTESARHQNRQKCYANAMELLKEGKVEDANRLFTQSVDISPAMACYVKNKLEEIFASYLKKLVDDPSDSKEDSVEKEEVRPGVKRKEEAPDGGRTPSLSFIVAPYEADSQLAYLSRTGLADVIITEDSDLLVFGAKRMFYKMDRDFAGDEVALADIGKATELNFKGWSHDKFIQFCIVCGCDYLDSPTGIGPKKAYAAVAESRSFEELFDRLKDRVPEDYPLAFHAAFLAFKFQRVFCPIKGAIVNLCDFNPFDVASQDSQTLLSLQKTIASFGNLDFLGRIYPPEISKLIACCRLDPISKQPFPSNFEAIFSSKRKLSSSIRPTGSKTFSLEKEFERLKLDEPVKTLPKIMKTKPKPESQVKESKPRAQVEDPMPSEIQEDERDYFRIFGGNRKQSEADRPRQPDPKPEKDTKEEQNNTFLNLLEGVIDSEEESFFGREKNIFAAQREQLLLERAQPKPEPPHLTLPSNPTKPTRNRSLQRASTLDAMLQRGPKPTPEETQRESAIQKICASFHPENQISKVDANQLLQLLHHKFNA